VLHRGHAPPADPPPSKGEDRVVYGDSTPFAFGLDFLEAIRSLVDCCVGMLSTQTTIDQAVEHSAELERDLQGERRHLGALMEAVRDATQAHMSGPARVRTAAQQVFSGARSAFERSRGELERQWKAELSGTERIVDEACTTSYQSLEGLLLAHVPPQSSVAWRLGADDEGYAGQLRIDTRFGLQAQFSLAIPQAHRWAKLVRVGDLSPSTSAPIPRPIERRGRGGLHTVALDKLVISEALLEPDRIVLTLRKGARSGAGCRIEVTSETGVTTTEPVDEAGRCGGDVYTLDRDGREALLPLISAVLDSTFDLVLRRQLMTAAAIEGRSLRDRHEPHELCRRLIGAYAPIVAEIAKRSSPTELVLRRHVADGRREAVFLRRDELVEKIGRLPPALRALFDPLGL
jgi:hypothetical protein